jgi:catechol 2,3-dioxygenase-like lactoylglutathione lyase family enzyme
VSFSPLHHCNISVTDLEGSVAFYCDVFGCRVTMRSPIGGPDYERYTHVPAGTTGEMVMLQLGDDPSLGLIELIQWCPPVEPTPPKRFGDPGLALIAVQVHDETLEEVRERLRGQGVEPWSDILAMQLAGYPPFRGMIVEDPDGTLVELIHLPTRDEIRAFRNSSETTPRPQPA